MYREGGEPQRPLVETEESLRSLTSDFVYSCCLYFINYLSKFEVRVMKNIVLLISSSKNMCI